MAYPKSHPVARAVAPLREKAIERAEVAARAFIASVAAKLAEHDDDFNAAYPYPSSGDRNYLLERRIRAEARSVTRSTGAPVSYAPNAPLYREVGGDGVGRYVKQAREAADAAYEAFVVKLVSKVGDCESAKIDCTTGVWSYSDIVVVKAGGVREVWRTQQILNRSKRGLWYNQWPTRKLKR